MNDRGMIKWAPFNSVIPSNIIINNIMVNKNKNTMPTLSEDKIEDLEEKLKEALTTQKIVNIKYFYNGNIFIKQGKIKFIDSYRKKVVLNDSSIISFYGLLDIY